jgi:hypothetical protein
MSRMTMGRNRGWAGGLLLCVQLLVLAVAPLFHAYTPIAADHIEAPGTHTGGHDDAACHVCRAVDARFAPAPLPNSVAGIRISGEARKLVPASRLHAAPLLVAVAPRGPPAT